MPSKPTYSAKDIGEKLSNPDIGLSEINSFLTLIILDCLHYGEQETQWLLNQAQIAIDNYNRRAAIEAIEKAEKKRNNPTI